MSAKRVHCEKIYLTEQTFIEIVLWKLNEPTNERPHGYKYRLHFGTKDGGCIVRYDNKTGKGDHKHLGHLIVSYRFVDSEKLLDDFYSDVLKYWSKII